MPTPRLAYTAADGSLAIVRPQPDARLVLSATDPATGLPVLADQMPMPLGQLKGLIASGVNATLEPADAWLARVAEHEARSRLPQVEKETPEEYAGRLKAAVAARVRTTQEELAPLRRWRDCLTVGVAGVVVDLDRAREQRCAELEKAREAVYAALRDGIDAAFDLGDDKALQSLLDQRKALRALDLTAAVASAKDVTDLETVPAEISQATITPVQAKTR